MTIPRKTRKAKRAATPLHPNRGKKAKKKPSVLRQEKRIKATRAQMKVLRQQVYDRQIGYCGDCNADVRPDGELHHIKFRSQGGRDEASNLVLLCRRCHNKRHGIRSK